MAELTLVHTTDMHNTLDDARAARLGAIRDALGDPLLLDSGDAIRAGNIYFLP